MSESMHGPEVTELLAAWDGGDRRTPSLPILSPGVVWLLLGRAGGLTHGR